MPSPIYQYMVNLAVSLPTRGGPGFLMNVSVREHCALNSKTFFIWQYLLFLPHYHYCPEVDSHSPLSFWKFSLSPILHWHLLTEFSYGTLIEHLLSFLIKSVSLIITSLLTWCMHIQNNDVTAANSQNCVWHPITSKRYSLNCWHCSVVYWKSCSQLIIIVSFSIEKIVFLCSYMLSSFHLTSCTPTKSNLRLANSLDTVVLL